MEIRTVETLEDGGFIVNRNIDENDDRQLCIPDDMSNRHRRKLQVWLDAGNTPDPYVPPANEPIISMDAFEARFTTQEWDDAYDFVYEVDITTGLHKRKALVQGWNRAMARGTVDLSDAKTIAFMGALVAGGVITEAKKDIILTP